MAFQSVANRKTLTKITDRTCLEPPQTDGGGYGLTQITFNPNRTIVWNWAENIKLGKSRLSEFKSAANNWWDTQKEQWQEYNRDRAIRILPEAAAPQDKTYSGVTFGYAGAGKKPLWHADWIQKYNYGYGSTKAAWLVWKNEEWEKWRANNRVGPEPRPSWRFNEPVMKNSTKTYLEHVLSRTPCP